MLNTELNSEDSIQKAREKPENWAKKTPASSTEKE